MYNFLSDMGPLTHSQNCQDFSIVYQDGWAGGSCEECTIHSFFDRAYLIEINYSKQLLQPRRQYIIMTITAALTHEITQFPASANCR